jgi:hypothetical protein
MSAVAVSVASPAPPSRPRVIRNIAGAVFSAALLGAAAGMMAASGRAWEVIVLVGVLLPVVLWRRPQLGPVIIFSAALLIEQFAVNLPNGNVIGIQNVPITNAVPLFHGLGSLHLEPADLLLLAVFVVYMVRTSGDGSRWWPRSHVSLAMLAFVGALLYGEALGLAHHAQLRVSFQELRPLVYIAAAYLLTSVLIRTRSAVLAMLWALVTAEAIKSTQAIYLWIVTRPWHPHPQWVVGHEEAMFCSLFFFLVAALWLFGLRGRLRTVSTALVPLVFFADLVNERRAAWLILGAGLIVLAAVAYAAVPARRRMIRRVTGVGLIISAVYFPAFWNNAGTLGEPAQAFRSGIGSTSARNALSDDYRIEENANLELNMRLAGPLGKGFGIPIDYALPMPGLVNNVDPAIMFIPHNGVLYILMRMGLIGGVAFWALLGAAVISGCRLARCPDRQLALVGAFSAAAVVGWAFEGALDQGFTLSRAALVMGCVIGLAEAARHIHATSVVSARPRRRSSPGSAPRRREENLEPVGATSLEPVGATSLEPVGATNLEPVGAT